MRRKIIPYRSGLKDTAKMLRKSMSYPEILLWLELKGRKIDGYQFNRQRPIGDYIVDFYCKDLQLAIEVDGDDHLLAKVRHHDTVRQRKLESLGVKFLRFTNDEVLYSTEFVVDSIRSWIREEVNGTHP